KVKKWKQQMQKREHMVRIIRAFGEIVIFTMISMFILTLESKAGAYQNFGKAWSESGGVASTTSPQYYKGQKAGHYSMGSMYFARVNKNRTIMSVRFPEINLDKSFYAEGVLDFGGISFISGKELM